MENKNQKLTKEQKKIREWGMAFNKNQRKKRRSQTQVLLEELERNEGK